MRIVYFTHSLRSCWNHGNAHFLRGVLRELIDRGHDVTALEPEGAWSLQNLLADHGDSGLAAWQSAYPDLSSQTYSPDADLEALVGDADLVIVHEWNDPELVAKIGRIRQRGGRFLALFHDTHHRAISAPHELKGCNLPAYDGILAFGDSLAQVYRDMGWGDDVFVWHEAADTRLFHPPQPPTDRTGLIWIGNWGDGERTGELEDYLFRPARDAGLPLDIYGVRYSDQAVKTLKRYGAAYHGWLPNAKVPEVFARHVATVHVPRRFYATSLPGIPTIRVFEALACGIPLVTAPWSDCEQLFRPGIDYLVAKDGAEMTRHLRALKGDPDLCRTLAENGLQSIRTRHSCSHRAEELLAIAAKLRAPTLRSVA